MLLTLIARGRLRHEGYDQDATLLLESIKGVLRSAKRAEVEGLRVADFFLVSKSSSLG